MSGENVLTRLNQRKAIQRQQLKGVDVAPPTLLQFWTQPHGVRLLLVEVNFMEQIASVVHNRGAAIASQRLNKMVAYPAHVGTLLSRRRRTLNSVALAAWFSNGWTKVQETTGGTVSTDDPQIAFIARKFGARVIAIHYDQYNQNLGLIEATADGEIPRSTYLTAVLTRPVNPNHHPNVVKHSNPDGLMQTLRDIGIDIPQHVSAKVEMMTVLNCDA